MQNKKEVSWQIFDKIAPTYDVTNRVLSFGRDLSWRRKLSKHLPPKKNLKILDLATGTGDQIISLFSNPKISIQKVTGLDLSKEMLEIAKKKLASLVSQEKVNFLQASGEQIPLPANSFDAVTLSFGIRNMPNPSQALKEMHRVLKPQGKCLILEFSLPPFPIKPFYLLYLRKILPRIGGFLSKSKEAYRYLNETIETFPYGRAFVNLMKGEGFQKIEIHPLMFGSVTLYIGEKS